MKKMFAGEATEKFLNLKHNSNAVFTRVLLLTLHKQT